MAAPRKKVEGKEAQLASAWAALGTQQAELVTQEGEHVRVLFAGLPGTGAGPDFRHAVFATERGRVVRGDVEVHQAASGWEEHGHSTDPRYRRVVLHVVGTDDRGEPTPLPLGGRVPVLEIAAGAPAAPACGECRSCIGDALPEILAELGLARFRAKAAQMRRRIERDGADHALYSGVLDTLGVGPNRALFQRLGAELSWDDVRLEAFPGVLLGAGGFFLDERPSVVPEQRWQELHDGWRSAGSPVVVAYEEWQRWGSRPRAAPWVRLLGAGCLFTRLGSGPANVLMQWAETAGASAAEWRKQCAVSAEEAGLAWAPIGGSRADALVVNVLLPLLAAMGFRGAEEVFRRYPALEEDTVVRNLKARLGIEGLRLTACQQQGFHQLHRWYCERGRQEKCPLRPTSNE